MNTKHVGEIGENLAVKYLKKNGYKILDRNYVLRFSGAPQSAEIDIVAKKDNIISFVEVKTILTQPNQKQGQSLLWLPEEKVNVAKQRKIMRAAETWLSKHKIDFDSPMQIDIIAVTIDRETQKASIRYLPNIG